MATCSGTCDRYVPGKGLCPEPCAKNAGHLEAPHRCAEHLKQARQ